MFKNFKKVFLTLSCVSVVYTKKACKSNNYIYIGLTLGNYLNMQVGGGGAKRKKENVII